MVLMAVTLRSFDIMPCSLLRVGQSLGETYHPHLWGRRVSKVRDQQKQVARRASHTLVMAQSFRGSMFVQDGNELLPDFMVSYPRTVVFSQGYACAWVYSKTY
jgi:hypothetical protein